VARRAVAIPDWRPGGQAEQPAQVVVSSTLEDPDWNNSTVLKGDVVASRPASSTSSV
jgi:hypothetical protein